MPKDDEPGLLITPSWDLDRAKMLSWIGHVMATNDFSKDLEDLILEKNWKRKNVGLIGTRRLTTETRKMIASKFEIVPQPTESVVTNVATVRDELEFILAMEAAVIAEEGYQHLLRSR